jgi:NusB family.
MNRRTAREDIMKMLYEYEITGDDPKSIMQKFYGGVIDENQRDYITSTFFGIFSHLNDIDNVIRNNLKGWKLERLAKVDQAILRCAIYEVIYG